MSVLITILKRRKFWKKKKKHLLLKKVRDKRPTSKGKKLGYDDLHELFRTIIHIWAWKQTTCWMLICKIIFFFPLQMLSNLQHQQVKTQREAGLRKHMGGPLIEVGNNGYALRCCIMGVGVPSGWPTTSVVGHRAWPVSLHDSNPILHCGWSGRTVMSFCQTLFRQMHCEQESDVLFHVRGASFWVIWITNQRQKSSDIWEVIHREWMPLTGNGNRHQTMAFNFTMS